jgi:phenylacetic acid degradation operon negative regulatory protein
VSGAARAGTVARGAPSPGLAALLAGPDRPVWSLIVTALGDRTQVAAGPVATSELLGELSPAGVSATALRTALHRLRADGWVATARTGRSAAHRLTPRALREVEAASPRIYGLSGPEPPAVWSLVFGDGAAADGAVRLAEGLWLRPAPLGASPGLEGATLRLTPGQQDALWPARLRRDGADLRARLAAALDRPAAPADRAALRLLTVHDWRRIALRLPPLPDALAPADWPGAALRASVARALDCWPRDGAVSAPGRS